jgi:ADP-ribose pyrophosphatase YjhB (NUDIX family)
MRHSHCTYCGTAFAADAGWPRTCPGCGEMTWHNPLPVAVVLLPVRTPGGTGLIVVRRAIQPGYGQLGLPGGFMEVGESWQQAAVRELREETTIEADPTGIRLFDVHSTPTGHTLLVFGLLPPRDADDLPPVTATDETLEWLVATEPVELVFSTHTRAMADYFASA